jgi:nucleotide-binding universal stress UspA family protein
MGDRKSTRAVVVGIDGSPAAHAAAIWVAGEAADRNLPLKLVYVIHSAGDPADPADPLAAAASALSQARQAVQAIGGVQVETVSLQGNPLATLIELSHSAAIIAVGSAGVAHTCHHAGSTAAALAGSAGCPVAVIRSPDTGQHTGPIVAEVDASPDNRAVLGWALAEAKLRHAPLRVVASDDRVRGRLDEWARRHPSLLVEAVVADDVDGYLSACLAEEADTIQLFISGTSDRRRLGWAGGTGGCSVLTVGGAPR